MSFQPHYSIRSGRRTVRASSTIRPLWILALISLIVVSAGSAFGSDDEQAPKVDSAVISDWQALGQAWEKYLEYPSTERAAKLYDVIPPRTSGVSDDPYAAAIIDSIYQNLRMLERQVYAGDRNAVKVAFRMLFRISDGDFAEWLDIILGSLIRINPRLFLQEYKAHRGELDRIDGLLGNYGDIYYDQYSAHDLETVLRIEALRMVTDEDLIEVREECISELEDNILGDVEG